MEPFKSTEVRHELAAKGILEERLAFAKEIGNHKPDPFQFRQALTRTARQYLKSQGVSDEKMNELIIRAPPPAWRGMPTTGVVKIFALLIEFSDYQHNIDINTINSMLFGSPATGYPYESLANYYKRASYHKLDLSHGTTLGWYRTSKKRSDVKMDKNGRDSLIKEALQYFEAQGHNFAQYDNNNDGVIDYFMVFWTGPDTGWATFWWGYQTTFSDSSFKLDGKSLRKYSWQWESNPVGSAFDPLVAIHETGHALGLPDLYDYDGNIGPDGGVGGADMMDANWLDHNSFSKWMMEWLEPTIIEGGKHIIALNPSGASQDCVAIWPDLLKEGMFSEFFIVQNRSPVENDVQLPGNGLMILHVDARLDPLGNNFNFNNSFTDHKLVRLMEADGLEDIEANRGFNARDLYVSGKKFGPSTVPSSNKYDGKKTNVEVSNIINASGSQISAVFVVQMHGKKLFIEALRKKYGANIDLTRKRAAHKLVARDQSGRKKEFMEYAKTHHINIINFQWGDWQLQPNKISGTEYFVEIDDLHFINNPAIQQMWDDIRRTIIVGLDIAHGVLEKRLGKEVNPETINNYLEILDCTITGSAISPDFVAEPHPGLVKDGNVRLFTGDDFLADKIDSKYLIDINKLFPADQAEQLKAAIGKTTWQVFHVPTILVRSCDGTATVTWSAIQSNRSFVEAYNLCSNESTVAEIVYAASSTAASPISTMQSSAQVKGFNNPSGLSFGNLVDIIQTSRVKPTNPVGVSLNAAAAGAALYDQIWLGGYLYGGSGFTEVACAAYMNDILDDFCYYGIDYGLDKFGRPPNSPKTQKVARDLAVEITAYGMEQFERYPTLLETCFGGSQIAYILAAATGITVGTITGNSQLGLNGFHLSQLIHREGWGRLGGSLGYDMQDHCGPNNAGSYQPDEGNPLELRGPNYPGYSSDAGHFGGYTGIISAVHASRGDAFAVNPLIKIAFANPSLASNWADVRTFIGKGASRKFRAEGERDLVMPLR